MTQVRVRDVLARLSEEIPAAWAEPWDRVGLLVGDPDSTVERVFAALDPTPVALKAAIDAGAQVLLTHHPAFLEPPARLTPQPGLAGVPFAAVSAGVALVCAHTNLDRSPAGADALPAILGLTAIGPLERGAQPSVTIVTYVPSSSAPAVIEALGRAGAGRIGMYEACSFESAGTGRFTPLAGSSPRSGEVGVSGNAQEARIEAVCDSGRVDAVLVAIREAHPYEEPVILTSASALARGTVRMGRVCEVASESTLASFASDVGRVLGVRPTVWGDPRRSVTRIGTAPGSGRSLVPDALEAGVDVLLTGELRYHEALDAVASGLCVIEAGHDATEWPMVPVLGAVAASTAGLDASRVTVDRARVEWWTAEGS